MKLSWNKRKGALGYVVNYICGDLPKEKTVGDVTHINLSDLMLKADTEYDFYIIAVNKQGRSLPSQTIKYTTPESVSVPKPVEGLKIGE